MEQVMMVHPTTVITFPEHMRLIVEIQNERKQRPSNYEQQSISNKPTTSDEKDDERSMGHDNIHSFTNTR